MPNYPYTKYLISWIMDHKERFRPSPRKGLGLFSVFQPLGELCYILWGCYGKGPFPIEIHQMIHEIYNNLNELYDASIWEKLKLAISKSPLAVEMLQPFFMVETWVGKPFAFHNQMVSLLKKTNHKNQEMAVRFCLEWVGHPSCAIEVEKQVILFIERSRSECLRSSDLYELTHLIFYGSYFGNRSFNYPDSLAEILRSYMFDRYQKNDLDLTAELLAARLMLGIPPEEKDEMVYQKLIKNIRPHSVHILKQQNLYGRGDYFGQQYHLVLVTLLAIERMHKVTQTSFNKHNTLLI